jgi:hypothetical protein
LLKNFIKFGPDAVRIHVVVMSIWGCFRSRSLRGNETSLDSGRRLACVHQDLHGFFRQLLSKRFEKTNLHALRVDNTPNKDRFEKH